MSSGAGCLPMVFDLLTWVLGTGTIRSRRTPVLLLGLLVVLVLALAFAGKEPGS